MSDIKSNFRATIAGLRSEQKRLEEKRAEAKAVEPAEYEKLKAFAAEYISDEIHKQTFAFADKTHVVIGKDEFTNEMSHLCRSERFKNFNSKDDIPIKQLVNYVCSYLSDEEDNINVSCNYYSDNFEIRLKY